MLLEIADPTLASLLAELRDVNDRLQRYLAGSDMAVTRCPGEWPALADDLDLISVAAAAERSRQSTGTIRRWCRDDGIGRKYGKDWLVSCSRLASRLDN